MTITVNDQDQIKEVSIANMPLEYLVESDLKLNGELAKADSTEFLSHKGYEMTSTGYVWPFTVLDPDGDQKPKGVVELFYTSHHKGKKRPIGTALKEVSLEFRSSAWNSLCFYFDGFIYSYTAKKRNSSAP